MSIYIKRVSVKYETRRYMLHGGLTRIDNSQLPWLEQFDILVVDVRVDP